MDVQGGSLSTICSLDMKGVSISPPPTVKTCNRYPFHHQHQQYGPSGCIPFHRQQYGSAGYIHFHSQQYGRAGCIPFHWQQYRFARCIPFPAITAVWMCRVYPIPPSAMLTCKWYPSPLLAVWPSRVFESFFTL
jgi:hypothetical protein